MITASTPGLQFYVCTSVGVSGPAAAQWQSALKAYLVQSGGETDMSKLGSVRKPEGIPKGQRLKAFLQQHPDVFAVDGNSVTLK